MKAFRSEFDNIIKSLEFYQLKIGDEFRAGKTIYKKISDDFAVSKIKRKKKLFWPQDTAWLLEEMKRDEIHEKYPLTSYIY